MHVRALSSSPASSIHLQHKHAFLLVISVLLIHLWVLTDMPLWLAFDSGKSLHTQALVTRQIEVQAITPHTSPAPKLHSPIPTQPAPIQQAEIFKQEEPPKPLKLDNFDQDITTHVSPPTEVASNADSPSYKRVNSDGLTDITAFKAPDSVLLKYKVQGQAKGFNYWASAELDWQQDGKDYEARLEVSAFLLGSRIQVSKGTLGAEGIMPTRFGDKTRSELAAHFQRDKGIISFSANSPDVPLLKGAQDRLSVVLQISSLLAADPMRFPAGTVLSFQTVSQREAEVWQFSVEKEEMLQLPFGEIGTIKLNRQPRRAFDQHIELWFAPSLSYLPVRLRITNANGDFVDQLLSKVDKPIS